MKTKKLIKILRNDPQFVDTEIMAEAANRLELLSVELKKTHAKLAAASAERDAAIADIQRCCNTCALCSVNNGTGQLCPWMDDCNQVDGDHWEWRGVTDTNVGGKKEEG